MVTRKITVTGMVQGIGFRPYIAELAERIGIAGSVRNADGIVIIEAQAAEDRIEQLISQIRSDPPFGAHIDRIRVEKVDLSIETGTFQIIRSSSVRDVEENTDALVDVRAAGVTNHDNWTLHIPAQSPFIPPDLPTCPVCEKQLLDRSDRRFRYPFISCTACGPRYSIIREIPYDREHTVMDEYKMCPECKKEYTQPRNMRRHAQTIACHKCGPQLSYWNIAHDSELVSNRESAYQSAVSLLKAGGIVAIKDIGGFHLACSPFSDEAVQRLRLLKGREKKPFAVMFEDIEQVLQYCCINSQEQKLLAGIARPIVLLRKKTSEAVSGKMIGRLASGVCMNSPDIGAMLPCNPLQILLVRDCGPLIMTSANRSGEPILTDNKEVMEWFRQYARQQEIESEKKESQSCPGGLIGALMHDRKILSPLDDSVVCMAAGHAIVLRRGRGMVPQPVNIPEIIDRTEAENPEQLTPEDSIEDSIKDSIKDPIKEPIEDSYVNSYAQIFAAGGDLKSTFCFMSGDRAYLSQYLGDVKDEKISMQYDREKERMRKLFHFSPELSVCDLHPDYLTVKKLGNENNVNQYLLRVQHHHAHIASVVAEHGLTGDVLGIAYDGTGYGTDHSVWGSEFLLCNGADYRRVAHLQPVTLSGGDEGVKNADLTLYGYLTSLKYSQSEMSRYLSLNKTQNYQYQVVASAVKHKIHTVTSTSMGRLFDAVSALLGICHYSNYEGEAAIELSNAAQQANRVCPLHMNVVIGEGELQSDTRQLFQAILDALDYGWNNDEIAAGFIHAIADYTVQMVQSVNGAGSKLTSHPIRQPVDQTISQPIRQIALSGGTFQNRMLLERVVSKLSSLGYAVYWNEQVPMGDGGISLGQAYLAWKQTMESNRY